jgi:DNA-binding protein WhiA
LLADFLAEMGWVPKSRSLDGGIGLYFKKNAVIEEIISTVGANQALFALINAKIARDIRNEENRATNCVAHNIGKTVNAARRVCLAVEKIREQAKYDLLPIELKETAELRIENPEASLGELAAMHVPPITKSGLNHRLQKILAFADGL